MGVPQAKSEERFDEVYGNIAKLYDHAEDILKVAYDESASENEDFIHDIENLVGQIEESANTIAKDFSCLIETGEEPDNIMKSRVSAALKKLLIVIDQYKEYDK